MVSVTPRRTRCAVVATLALSTDSTRVSSPAVGQRQICNSSLPLLYSMRFLRIPGCQDPLIRVGHEGQEEKDHRYRPYAPLEGRPASVSTTLACPRQTLSLTMLFPPHAVLRMASAPVRLPARSLLRLPKSRDPRTFDQHSAKAGARHSYL